MKVDTSRLKKGTSDVPTECQALIDKLRTCSMDDLLIELNKIDTWTFGKSELYHWIDILDIFDGILEEATKQIGNDWFLACDERFPPKKYQLLLAVLNFTTLLIEHSFSRHLYNSVEHLTQLLSSTNMDIVLGVLNLLYMFSKRSNFIPRLNCSKRNSLLARLTYIAESWGGKEHGYGLAECCNKTMKTRKPFPKFYYEYYDSDSKLRSIEQDEFNDYLNITNPSEIAYLMCCRIPVTLDNDQKMLIFTRVRLSLSFARYETRLQFVLARLQALSVLVYSNSLQDNINSLLYPGFLEELVELLEMRESHLVEIRAAALRTLTSIIHLDRNPHFPKKPGTRMNMIIDVTGAASYHGFLPTLVRTCIQHLTSPGKNVASTSSTANDDQLHQYFPLTLATALFSFLYHLASYESGGDALVACGMMESLLRVINWPGRELEHITFVTRAVRVIDLITNIEMQSFQNHGGLQSFIGRLEMEVNLCREEQPSELVAAYVDRSPESSFIASDDVTMIEASTSNTSSTSSTVASTTTAVNTAKTTKSCLPQRAALLKSMLNFLKKAIQDTAFSDSIRRVMESSLPSSLRHIISNAEYYGPSLFLLATDVVTVYVFQEPSLLYSLQDSGLTDVVLQALLKKDVPPTREVLGSLPNVFSALCMNSRGLAAFVQYKPFDRLFEVLLSPVYLQAMRRRRSSEPMGDTASNLGNAMDELMRHQPSLKSEATKAIIRLLQELVKLGTDDKYVCWRAQNNKNDENFNIGNDRNSSNGRDNRGNNGNGNGSNNRHSIHVRVLHVNNSMSRAGVGNSMNHGSNIMTDQVDSVRNNINSAHDGVDNVPGENNAGSSDEDDDDEEEASTSSHHNQRVVTSGLNCERDNAQNASTASSERKQIPLIDYILNVMKFVDAILSNNSTDDHCREFVAQGGLQPLLRILSLPNLPVDSPITTSAQAVAAVCKSILSLAHEPMVLQVALEQLAEVVDQLEPLQSHWDHSQGSILLRELANCKNIDSAFSNATETPLLHAMGAVHGYVVMWVHVCRTGQSEIRNLLIESWGQNNAYGQKLLYKLVQLYTALVWESTLLLALCTDDIIPPGCDFGKEDLDKLPKDKSADTSTATTNIPNQSGSTPIHIEDVSPENSTDAKMNDSSATSVTSMSELLSESVLDIDRVLNSFDASVQDTATADGQRARPSSSSTPGASSKSSQSNTTQRKNTATPSQLRYIKSLLGASSRLGRALAELFGLLVKLCVGNRIRMRQIQNVSSNYMSSEARDIARVLSYIIVNGLSHDQLPPSPIPKLKQTFLICSIGFTSPMLFDDKRFAYHLMLHKFVEEGGIQALFDMFSFAMSPEQNAESIKCDDGSIKSIKDSTKENAVPSETTVTGEMNDLKFNDDKSIFQIPRESPIKEEEHGEFPAGSGEFLDSWLMLLEKMVNTKAILEAPHVIAMKSLRNKPEFDAVAYLINVHRLAFDTVTKIWSYKPIRTYGPRMTESILTIMKHIYKGAPILRERYQIKNTENQNATDKNDVATKPSGTNFYRTNSNQFDRDQRSARISNSETIANNGSNNTSAASAQLNEAHLNQLMDMGFLQEHCREALFYTASVEQATEYLLENSFATSAGASNSLSGNNATSTGALSATNNQNAITFENIFPGEDDDDDDDDDDEMASLMGSKNENSEQKISKRSRRGISGMRSTQYVLPNDPPLSEEILNEYSETAVRTTLYLIDQVPDAVFKGTELLAILFKRDDIKWKMVATIIGTLVECADTLHAMLCDRTTPIETVCFGDIACRFTVRLHIFCLFLEGQYADLRTPTILSMKEFKLMPKLIRLLNETEAMFTAKAGKCPYTPKWIAQMILLIDLYEKVVVLTRRRNEMHRITTQTWKWYDVASGKWNAYSVSNNKIINDAYWAGELSVRVSVGRHRYTINFNCMSQVNEETGNHRPVVLGLLSSLKRAPERNSSTLSYIFGSDNEDGNNKNVETNQSAETKINTKKSTPTPAKRSTTQPAILSTTENELDRITATALREMRANHLENNFRTNYAESMISVSMPKRIETPSITPEDVKLLGLEEFTTELIVATCVRLMSPQILMDRDSLHALMKLCVRLTTKYENAEVFAREGGVKLLLEMKQTCGYIGFATLANLLIRHTLEEPKTLASAMETVIAARTLQTIPPGYRDLIFMLRRMSSAVARDPDTFKQVARAMLRIDVNALRRGVFSEDYRLIMKSIPTSNSKRQPDKLNDTSMPVRVIYDLLQALVVPAVANNNDDKSTTTTTNSTNTNQGKNSAPNAQQRHNNNSNSSTSSFCLMSSLDDFCEEQIHSNHINIPLFMSERDSAQSALSTIGTIHGDSHQSQRGSADSRSGAAGNRNITSSSRNAEQTTGTHPSYSNPFSGDAWNMTTSKNDGEKPLLPKSTILKALAEAVRSYQSVGTSIVEYTYQPQPNTLIRKTQTALAFILDYFLPSTEQNPDRDCSSGARVLIAALSASAESQYTVVTEVRNAILRALSWPEIPEKHQQLQALTALIPTMIENCPPENPALLRMHQHQPRRNDIFNIMVRKGLITDLANITQNLDLSSPHSVHTIGTALKSLETLLRMSNQPVVPVPVQVNKSRNSETNTTSTDNTDNANFSDRQRTLHSLLRNNGQPAVLRTIATVDSDRNNQAQNNEITAESQSVVETENISNDNLMETNAIEQNTELVVAPTAEEAQANESDVSNVEANEGQNIEEAIQEMPRSAELVDQIISHYIERGVPRTSVSSGVATRGSISTSVVTGGSSGSTGGGSMQPIELPDERFMLDEEDTSSDSDSNGSEENDEEREEEIDDDENEDEAEDRSDLEVDEETRQFIEMYDHVYGRNLSPSIPELERDNEDILMIQYADNGREVSGGSGTGGSVGVSVSVTNNIIGDENEAAESNASNVAGGSGLNRVSASGSNNSNANEGSSSSRFLLHSDFPNIFETNNISRHDEGTSGNGDASNESAAPGSPSAPNVRISNLHISTGNQRSNMMGGNSSQNSSNPLSQLIQFRTQRSSNRQRRCAYFNLNGRNPPAILQRLLGPSVAHNVNIGLGQVIANANGSASFRDATRVVVMDNGFGIFANGEPSIDLVDQAGYLFGRSLAATLNSTPSPLHWWLEEAKVLGLESQADVCLTVCNELIPDLERQRSLELSKNRSKRKKKSTSEDNPAASGTTAHKQKNSDSTTSDFDASSITAALALNGLGIGIEPTPRISVSEQQNNVVESMNVIDQNALGDSAHDASGNANNIENYDSDENDESGNSDHDEYDEEDENSSKNEEHLDLDVDEQNTTGNSNLNNSNVDEEDDENDDEENEEEEEDEDDLENENENDNEEEDEEVDENVIQLPHLSFVESNEEMTESDCNAQEEESNQLDDEDNGNGSGSDSGRSISSSVSTEPFFALNAAAATVTQTTQQNDFGSIRENPTSNSASNVIAAIEREERLLNRCHLENKPNFQEMCNAIDESENVTDECATAASQSTEQLHPLTLELESTSNNRRNTAATSSGDNENDSYCDIEKILKALKTEFNLNQGDDNGDVDNNDETNADDQENKRQRMTDQSNQDQDGDDSSTSNHPRRRLIRGRRSGRTSSDAQANLEIVEANIDAAGGSNETVPAQTATSDDGNNGAINALGSASIPEGIDPSFLAALPEDMRDEVIAEHLRIQRMQERARVQQQAAIQNEQAVVEVNPEFLAALPPNIQEEVLAQQRIEQQRLAAAAANPNDPVDAAAFFQNLQPSLRQAILTDMEDSQISVLPPELAAEAQNLRRDWENRNRQMMQEQMNQIGGSGGGSGNVGSSSFSSVLRYRSRLPEPIFSAHGLQRMRWSNWGMNSNSALGHDGGSGSLNSGRDLMSANNILTELRMEQQGRPLLDHESLTSLLILLFIEANKICTLRFHRVIRNLCYHVPTREWIIRTILSIISRSNIDPKNSDFQQTISNRPHWLNIRFDSALGNRNNIFIIQRKRSFDNDESMQVENEEIDTSTGDQYTITIHPQAAQVVCRHALDLLISLAKNFPANFLPIKKKPTTKKEINQPSTSDASKTDVSTDFWDILLRLEMKVQKNKMDRGRREISILPPPPIRSSQFTEMEINSFAESPFGQLISMLSYDIILKSTVLTDKLLRLLSFISIGLPEAVQQSDSPPNVSTSEEENAANTTTEATNSTPQLTATTTATASTTASTSTSGNQSSKSVPIQIDKRCLPETQDNLRLAIEVLTSKSCSEEGLEDATSLLLNLSQCSNVTRTFILNLLIDGARYLANIVQTQINDLIIDLRALNQRNRTESSTPAAPEPMEIVPLAQNNASHRQISPATATAASKGILQDRFTKETVVITSTSKQKTRCELQLPSMVPLISKTASQSFFLRILKVVIQIRESAKEAATAAATRNTSNTTSSTAAASTSGTATNNASQNQNTQSTNNLARTSTTSSNIVTAANKNIVLNQIELQPLSETLQLDHLWDTLSDCLVELEENADHHAVLVLQPAVEAFFLVHASSASSTNTNSNGHQSNNRNADDNSQSNASTTNEDNTNQMQTNDLSNNPPNTNEATAPVSPISLFDISNNENFVDQPSTDAQNTESSLTNSDGPANRLNASVQPAKQMTTDQKKFLQFAEKHRTVLNQILRQSTVHLSDGPFAVLVDHTRILDFDVKRRYFRTELERMDEGIRREELAVHVHRVTVFEDSFRELYRRNPEEWKNRFYIVFEDEEGQDAGGLLREWYVIISREIFNPMYALFTVSPGDRVTYMINPSSHANSNHLFYFKFVGRVIAKAIYDNKLLECYFTRSFYKHILGIEVNTQDMENEDYEFYKGLVYLMENHVSALGYDQTFSLEVQEFGVTEVRELIPNGRNIVVSEENKFHYIHLVCQLKMSGSIKQQLNAFLEGFYDIIPKRLISIFNEQELELLISGLPNVDIEDLKANTEYHKYQANSIQIQWFWRALRSFDQADRAKFLQFVTGTSKVPLQGFGALEGMNGVQKFQIHRDDRSTERLPSAHTCFNQLDLPVYKTYDKLRSSLLKAIHECSEGFGFA